MPASALGDGSSLRQSRTSNSSCRCCRATCLAHQATKPLKPFRGRHSPALRGCWRGRPDQSTPSRRLHQTQHDLSTRASHRPTIFATAPPLSCTAGGRHRCAAQGRRGSRGGRQVGRAGPGWAAPSPVLHFSPGPWFLQHAAPPTQRTGLEVAADGQAKHHK